MPSFADHLPPFPEPPLTIAVSECLTGAPVRYDGGHRGSAWPGPQLEGLYELRPICPEVGIGLGVPRDPIRLVGSPGAPRAVGVVEPSLDVTGPLQAYARQRLPELEAVDGYIFKARSPSCGLAGVALHAAADSPAEPRGRGLFAAEIARARPDLPLEDGENLFDAGTLESFVTRTFVHAFWRETTASGIDAARLVAFHSACKYLVMSHGVPAYRKLGSLIGDLSGDVEAIARRYIRELMTVLATPTTRGSHAVALQHLQGYLKRQLPADDRRRLADLIEGFRVGAAPLEAPLAELRRVLHAHGANYALHQYYLHVPRLAVFGDA